MLLKKYCKKLLVYNVTAKVTGPGSVLGVQVTEVVMAKLACLKSLGCQGCDCHCLLAGRSTG